MNATLIYFCPPRGGPNRTNISKTAKTACGFDSPRLVGSSPMGSILPGACGFESPELDSPRVVGSSPLGSIPQGLWVRVPWARFSQACGFESPAICVRFC